jgi:LysM repeat protein
MKRNPSLVEGLAIALIVAILVTGVVFLVAFEYFKLNPATGQIPAVTELSSAAPMVSQPAALPVESTTETPAETLTPSACPRPEGWEPYEMKTGDSLEALAGARLATLDDVMAGNCLSRPGALPGTIIYLPPAPPTITPTVTSTPTISPTATITLRACDYPRNWLRYTLKPGDTLFKLGVLFQTSEADLLTGNCLSFGTALHAGDILMVPSLTTATVTPAK